MKSPCNQPVIHFMRKQFPVPKTVSCGTLTHSEKNQVSPTVFIDERRTLPHPRDTSRPLPYWPTRKLIWGRAKKLAGEVNEKRENPCVRNDMRSFDTSPVRYTYMWAYCPLEWGTSEGSLAKQMCWREKPLSLLTLDRQEEPVRKKR